MAPRRDSRGRFARLTAPLSPAAPIEPLVEPKVTPGMIYVLDIPSWWNVSTLPEHRKRCAVYFQGPASMKGRYRGLGARTSYISPNRYTGGKYQPISWKNHIVRAIKPSPMFSLAHFSPDGPHITSSGCDPEFFAVDENGGLIPAFQYLPPKMSDSLLYADGFAGEITPSAGGCLQNLETAITRLLISANSALHEFNPKAHLTLQNTTIVPPSLMETASDEQVALGCTSSQNAYGLPEVVFENPRLQLLRSCGGHIHFGISDLRTPQLVAASIRAMDAIVGIVCVSLMDKFDNPERRQYYGRAGEYRTPAHGLEYRVLSNGWLAHPKIYHLVFTLARRVANIGMTDLIRLWEATEEEVRETIDRHDVQRARKILWRNEKTLQVLFQSIWGRKAVHSTLATIYDGLQSVIKEPDNLERNWGLTRTTPQLYTSWRSYAEPSNYPTQL